MIQFIYLHKRIHNAITHLTRALVSHVVAEVTLSQYRSVLALRWEMVSQQHGQVKCHVNVMCRPTKKAVVL